MIYFAKKNIYQDLFTWFCQVCSLSSSDPGSDSGSMFCSMSSTPNTQSIKSSISSGTVSHSLCRWWCHQGTRPLDVNTSLTRAHFIKKEYTEGKSMLSSANNASPTWMEVRWSAKAMASSKLCILLWSVIDFFRSEMMTDKSTFVLTGLLTLRTCKWDL